MSDVLVLNFSYEPMNITSLARAARLIFAGKAEVTNSRPSVIASPSFSMPMPSVVRMLYMIGRHKRRVSLTKRNVLLRDNYTCAYCGQKGDRTVLTVDHITPKSRGGASSWNNLVAACSTCNGRKNNRTPKEANMPLRYQPFIPKYIPWLRIRRHIMPDEWQHYIGLWNVSIEERVETRS